MREQGKEAKKKKKKLILIKRKKEIVKLQFSRVSE